MTRKESDKPAQADFSFSTLGIKPTILEILNRFRYITPTPIQQQAIPIAIEGKDVVGIAQTGTGKTLAFGIPVIQQIINTNKRGLIILPTRELAVQVDETMQKIGRDLGIKTAVLIGGASMRMQTQALWRKPNIIIATPGRLIDHVRQRNLELNTISIVVLDEADRMFDMGFAPQIQKILYAVPKEKQMMLFSATMPPEIMRMATGHMRLPIRIEVAASGTTAANVTQEIFIIPRDDKNRLLENLLVQHAGTTLIFTKMKHTAARLTDAIRDMGHTAAEIHSNRSLGQRRDALEGFKTGRYRVLIATDIASRGIDVAGINLVINYDLPTNSEDYVHRIGRTARAGAGGHAISFVMPTERRALRDIEQLIKKYIPISKVPELPPRRAPSKRVFETEPARRPFQNRRPSGSGWNRQPSFGKTDDRRSPHSSPYRRRSRP
jgi:ATP-dependent RNA helicase RhlE